MPPPATPRAAATVIPETPQSPDSPAVVMQSKRRRLTRPLDSESDDDVAVVVVKNPTTRPFDGKLPSRDNPGRKSSRSAAAAAGAAERSAAGGAIVAKLKEMFPDRAEAELLLVGAAAASVGHAVEMLLSEAFSFSPRRSQQQRELPSADGRGAPAAAAAAVWMGKDVRGGDTKRRLAPTNSKRRRRRRAATPSSDEGSEPSSGSDADAAQDDVSSLAGRDQDEALRWFNTATPSELGSLSGCGRTKANAIEQLRPFASFTELIEELEEHPKLSDELIWSFMALRQEQQAIQRVLTKCLDITRNFPKKEELCAAAERLELPSCIRAGLKLKAFQKIGLRWMSQMHKHDLNMILADEMGLGKTVQSISLLAHMFSSGAEGLFAIIVPSSVLDNWARELSTWCPSMSVCRLHGPAQERDELIQSLKRPGHGYHVVLTTYNVACGKSVRLFRKPRRPFECVVFDEGHMLKNCQSDRFASLMRIQAKRRVLLTGTPLQNNLLELMSLLTFTMPSMFADSDTDDAGASTQHLIKFFSRDCSAEGNAARAAMLDKAKAIMAPFVLRRKKDDVLTDLPAKRYEVEYCALTGRQDKAYRSMVLDFAARHADLATRPAVAAAGDRVRNTEDMGNVMMQLRKLANHPLLHRIVYTDSVLHDMARGIMREPRYHDADPQYIFEDMSVMTDWELNNLCVEFPSTLRSFGLPDDAIMDSAKLRQLQGMLAARKEAGDRVLLFSQFTMMLDILEVFLAREGYRFLRIDGKTHVQDRQRLIDQYTDDSSIFIFLLSTRAGGLGINLTAANVCILYDIDYNPQQDRQAEARCHRVGQTRPVTIVRIIAKRTVDEVILKRATEKLKLDEDMSGEGAGAESAVLEMLLESAAAIGTAKRSAHAERA